MSSQHAYHQFWKKMFGLTADELVSPAPMILSSGHYLDRHEDKYIFFYEDLVLDKKILAASKRNLDRIGKEFDLDNLDQLRSGSILSHPFFIKLPVAFQDMDCSLENSFRAQDFKDSAVRVAQITSEQDSSLEDFYKDCSDDDKDTLDLTFENESVLGVYKHDELAGVARSAKLKETALADITVLVRNKYRGQGLATPLVSRLVQKILGEGLYPKYRVAQDNLASIAIAEKLGFKPTYKLLAWDADKSLP